MKFVELKKSNDGKHKYEMVFLDTEKDKLKSVKFGASGYNDYIIYNKTTTKEESDKHKENYIKRHSKTEDWSDPIKKGTLSRYILWGERTLEKSLSDYLSRFPELKYTFKKSVIKN